MAATVMELYGSKVFNEHEMRERLPSSTYKSLKATIEKGQALDLEVANVVASVMKRWAIEQGATHYTHWFQPLTGITSEKHDGFVSPQKAFGLDVLSRIHYDSEHPGGVKDLQAVIVRQLEACIKELITTAGCPADGLYEISVAGNATMLHCLLGVPLASLGRAPYSSVFVQPMAVSARELGFSFSPGVQVRCLPSVSTYIGGDIVAGRSRGHGTLYRHRHQR